MFLVVVVVSDYLGLPRSLGRRRPWGVSIAICLVRGPLVSAGHGRLMGGGGDVSGGAAS